MNEKERPFQSLTLNPPFLGLNPRTCACLAMSGNTRSIQSVHVLNPLKGYKKYSMFPNSFLDLMIGLDIIFLGFSGVKSSFLILPPVVSFRSIIVGGFGCIFGGAIEEQFLCTQNVMTSSQLIVHMMTSSLFEYTKIAPQKIHPKPPTILLW